MKTPKQIAVVATAKEYMQQELANLHNLCGTLRTVMMGHEPLLGADGPGNTHGDNMEIKGYAKCIADRIRIIVTCFIDNADERYKVREELREKYFLDVPFSNDILNSII